MIYKFSEMYKNAPSNFNWELYYLKWLSPNLRSKLYTLKLNDAEHYFYLGLRYQYGIDCQKDLVKAELNYTQSANHCYSMAIYKQAERHLINYKQTGVLDRQQQMYLRFKSFAYIDPKDIDQIKGVDICMELAIHLDQEDKKLEKFNELMKKMQDKKQPNQILFIKAKRLIRFHLEQEDFIIGISILEELVANHLDLESAYALGCYYACDKNKYLKKDLKKAEEYFSICQAFKFYKAYYQFGRLLHQIGRYDEATKIFREGYINGHYCCLFNLISSQFWNFNLNKVEFLQHILDLQIIDIITGNLYSIFEFIYIKKVLKNRLPTYSNKNHDQFEQQIVSVVKEFYDIQRLKQIRSKDQIITAYSLIVRFGYFTKNLNQQDILVTEAMEETETKWLKRYCNRLIFKIGYEKCFGFKKNKQKKIPSGQELQILAKIQKRMFNSFNDMLNNEENSSYFFYFAKIYEKGWGVQPSISNSFLLLVKAVQWLQTRRLNISFVQFFRGAKAKLKLQQQIHTNSVIQLKTKCLNSLNDSPICQICYENKKQIFFFDCKHMCCKMCYKEVLKVKGICHLCRRQIKSAIDLKCFSYS